MALSLTVLILPVCATISLSILLTTLCGPRHNCYGQCRESDRILFDGYQRVKKCSPEKPASSSTCAHMMFVCVKFTFVSDVISAGS